jgi:4-amino-4-deoxy-L-arabinose transferase-like glycosyltransferase
VIRERLRQLLAAFESPRWLPLALGGGTLLRLLLLFPMSRVPLRADALSYDQMALDFLHGAPFDVFYPPGLSFLLLPAHWAFGESQVAARATLVLVWLCSALLLFAFARALAGRRAANLAVTFFALYPTSVWLSLEPLTQLPTALCLLGVALLAPRLVERPRLGAALLLGLCAGELALIRPSSLPLTVVAPLYLALRRVPLSSVAAALVAALLPVALWLAHARAVTGRFVMINDANALNFFLGNNPYTPLYKTWWLGSHWPGEPGVPEAFTAMREEIAQGPLETRETRYRAAAFAHIAARPELFLLRTANRVRVFFAIDSSTGGWLRWFGLLGAGGRAALLAVEAGCYLLVMAGAILYFCAPPPRDPLRRETGFVTAALAALYAAPSFIAFSHPTYHFPVVVLFLPLAAAWLERVSTEAPLLPTAARRRVALVSLLALGAVQVEWVVMNLDRLG